jgi:hypothetical protein
LLILNLNLKIIKDLGKCKYGNCIDQIHLIKNLIIS